MTQEKFSTLQTQNVISDAQNSVDKAHHAVSQAQTHPSQQLVQQAENALDKAQRAVAQAEDAGENPLAVQQAEEQLQQEAAQLNEIDPGGHS